MKEFTIDAAAAGQRLDKYIRRMLPMASASFPYKALRKKTVVVNEKKAEGGYQLQKGDVVRFYLADDTYEELAERRGISLTPYEQALRRLGPLQDVVVYEDDDCLVLNKPAGVLSQKASGKDSSAAEWLVGYLLEKKEVSAASLSFYRPSPCHRLDRNTSGLLICAKTLSFERSITACLREEALKKTYLAAVAGKLPPEGMVENYLRKQEETNTVTAFSEPVRGSKPAKTGFLKLAEQTVFAKKEGSRIPISLAAARLYTGRSHQLRVHFAGLGHPVLLDDKYGDGALNRSLRNAIPAKALPPGQLLHCARIEFPERDDLPQALRKKTLTAAPPAVFALLFPGVEAAQTGEGISQRP